MRGAQPRSQPPAAPRRRRPARSLRAAPTPRRAAWITLVPALLLAAPAGAQPPAHASVAPRPGVASLEAAGTASPAEKLLREGIRLQLEGRYEDALGIWKELAALDPTDPAAPAFETGTLFWIMLHDDEDTEYDAPITAGCERTIALATARLEADENDAYAHFMVGQGLMHRGRLSGWRGRYYAAGRDGERARKHIERALALRPDWPDARYQLGLYYFYASLIPELVTRWLGWLWFVPTGNADEGIRFLTDVAENGDLYRDEARFVLANIYSYHRPEKRAEGLAMIRELHARFPENVLMHFELIESLFTNEEYAETIAEAERLASRQSASVLVSGRATMARVWQARAEMMLGRPERTIELLATWETDPPKRPLWAEAWVELTRANALDVLGRRSEALAWYDRVLAHEKPYGSSRASALAGDAIATPYAPPRPAIGAAP